MLLFIFSNYKSLFYYSFATIESLIAMIEFLFAIVFIDNMLFNRLQLLLVVLLIVGEVDRGAHYVRVENEFGNASGCYISVDSDAMSRQSDVLIGMEDELQRSFLAWRY